MKRKLENLFLIAFAVSCIISCTTKTKIEKYNFKSTNNATVLNLSLPTGRIDICGWHNDFIEINATNHIHSLVFPEQNLIKFQGEEADKNFNLNVYTMESLIDAEINLQIKVPFYLQNLNISTDSAICSIADTFGNFNLTGKKGDVTGDFKNSTVKINLINGNINATFDLTLSTDVLLSNEHGDTNINIIKTGYNSFISARTYSGNINLVLNATIPYLLVSSASEPHTLDFLTSSPKIFENNNYQLFINNVSNETSKTQISLNNQSGKTKISNAFFIDIN